MSSNLEDAMRFAVLLARYAPAGHPDHWIVRDALAIGRDARSLARHAVNECNFPVTEREVKRAAMLRARLATALAPYAAILETSGDPRGYVVKVRVVRGESNGATLDDGRPAWGIA